MQLEISREALLRPLQLVSGALGGRPTLPILGNVLLDVSNGLLSLTGTDLEVEMIGQVYLNGASEDGRTTVPALLKRAGYATDPNYASKLTSTITQALSLRRVTT